MEHNDIDKYFKDRAPQFDEQPGDALWAKIQDGLDAPAPKYADRAPGKWVWILSGLVVIVIAGFIFFNYFTSEGDSWLTVPAPERVQGDVQEIPSEKIVEQSIDTVKPKVLAPKAAKNGKKTNNAVANLNLAPKPTTDTIYGLLMPDVDAAVPSPKAAPEPKKIKVSVQESAKRTVLTVREKISQQKFDSIVAASMEQYKSKAGMQLIVKGIQNETYRYTFPNTGGVNNSQDSAATKPLNKRAISATITTIKDSVRTERTVFNPTYDSVTDTYYVQYGKDATGQEPVYTAQLTVQPEFPGGAATLYSFIISHFRIPGAVPANTTATVHVSFIIEKDGTLSNIKVIKDPGYGMGAEAVRALGQLATKWKPGEVNGNIVRTAYFIPITIRVK